MPMKPDIVIMDEAAEIMPAPPTTEIKPWVPWEELDLKKIIQADRRYDLFGTETDEDQDVPDLQKLLQSLWQWQWPQQYYVFWEEKTKQPIFWKEREWMYDWVVVTDVNTIGKNVVQYSINWISQYWVMDLSSINQHLLSISFHLNSKLTWSARAAGPAASWSWWQRTTRSRQSQQVQWWWIRSSKWWYRELRYAKPTWVCWWTTSDTGLPLLQNLNLTNRSQPPRESRERIWIKSLMRWEWGWRRMSREDCEAGAKR